VFSRFARFVLKTGNIRVCVCTNIAVNTDRKVHVGTYVYTYAYVPGGVFVFCKIYGEREKCILMCVQIYIYARICIHIHKCRYIYICIYIHIHIYTNIYVYIYAYIYMYI